MPFKAIFLSNSNAVKHACEKRASLSYVSTRHLAHAGGVCLDFGLSLSCLMVMYAFRVSSESGQYTQVPMCTARNPRPFIGLYRVPDFTLQSF
jgi:hypothetical protein